MKKVFYILNLLFLTLLVFGGSVFAAATAPEYYLDEEGHAVEVPEGIQDLTGQTVGNDKPIGTGWYYIGDSWSPSGNNIVLASPAEVNIVVVNTPTITLTGKKIFVPSNGSLSFYGATTEGVATTTASLTINGDQEFVIGNYENGKNVLHYPDGDFGDITFNSGTYTVKNSTANLAIGSSDAGGGTITVNQAATVNAVSTGAGTSAMESAVAVGTPTNAKSCNINVAGGLLNCIDDNKYAFGISVGTGSLEISNQGKILSINNPIELKNWTIADSGGIIGYPAAGQYIVPANQWAAIVGGAVTLPVFGNYPQNLDPPAGSQYWNSVTVNPNGNLTLGAEDSDGNLQAALFLVGGNLPADSVVNNNGTVIINSVNQTKPGGNAAYPVSWNNNPGSTLTINSGATLNIWQNGFNNSAAEQGQAAGQVTVNGNLNITSPGKFTNLGSATVGQTGIVNAPAVNGSNTPDSPGASLTLDGEITGTLTNNSSGSVTVGSIGTVTNMFTNNPGGIVTSQNPCYYGNDILFKLKNLKILHVVAPVTIQNPVRIRPLLMRNIELPSSC